MKSNPHSFSEDGGLENRSSHRFRRFFDSFSCIETLTLKGFPDLEVLSAVLDTMGDLHLRKLVISSECNFDNRSMYVSTIFSRNRIYLIAGIEFLRRYGDTKSR